MYLGVPSLCYTLLFCCSITVSEFLKDTFKRLVTSVYVHVLVLYTSGPSMACICTPLVHQWCAYVHLWSINGVHMYTSDPSMVCICTPLVHQWCAYVHFWSINGVHMYTSGTHLVHHMYISGPSMVCICTPFVHQWCAFVTSGSLMMYRSGVCMWVCESGLGYHGILPAALVLSVWVVYLLCPCY